MRQSLIISVISYLFLISSLFGQEGYILNNLYFSGNKTFADDQLAEEISIYDLNWFETSILRKEKFVFSEEYLQADLKKLTLFYQRAGFLNVQIDARYLNLDHDDKIMDLSFIILEDTAVVVRDIEFGVQTENGLVQAGADSILDVIGGELIVQEGIRFQDRDIRTDQEKIINTFLNAGFAYVEVDYDLSIDENEKNLDVIWHIRSGPLCHFGLIQIIDEENISGDLILERVEFRTGDLYQKVLLDTTQRGIYALGLFQVVSVTALLDEQKNNIIPVKISVKRAPAITTRFGVGYGSEAKFRVFADIQKSAFLGGARRLNLLLSHSSIEPYNVDLKFIQPSILFRSMAFVINPFLRKQDEPGFRVERKGIKSTVLYSFMHRLTSSVSYTYEDVQRDTIDFGDEVGIPEERYRGLYDKSMFDVGLIWNTSFPLFDPEKGFMASINFQYNGIIKSVEFPFQKTIIDVRKYFTISNTVMALRMKLGGILPIRNNMYIPVEERFYSGGSYSIRGWARQELGPMDNHGRPLGGKSLLEFSTELRYPVYNIVGGVVFMDCGNVWIESYKWLINEIRYSLGAGIRVRTPIGPIRLDFARPVFDEEKTWQIHFSVGNAF